MTGPHRIASGADVVVLRPAEPPAEHPVEYSLDSVQRGLERELLAELAYAPGSAEELSARLEWDLAAVRETAQALTLTGRVRARARGRRLVYEVAE